MSEADRSILDKLPKKEVYRKRGWRGVLRDVWLAFRGKTFVTMRAVCFHCGQSTNVEAYQDCIFPIGPRCDCPDPLRLDAMTFNGATYFPTELMRRSVGSVLEAKTGDHLTMPELSALEERLGYGLEWWEKDTVENIKNRGAVRMEHRVHPDEA